jgi:hypothetical protein
MHKHQATKAGITDGYKDPSFLLLATGGQFDASVALPRIKNTRVQLKRCLDGPHTFSECGQEKKMKDPTGISTQEFRSAGSHSIMVHTPPSSYTSMYVYK